MWGGIFGSSDTELEIPMINEQYDYDSKRPGIFKQDSINAIKKIKASYSGYVNQASTDTGVPAIIIMGFMAYENPQVDPSLSSSAGAVGLSQITAETVIGTINLQLKLNDGLTATERSIINKYLPNVLKANKTITVYSGVNVKKALTNPEFNILIAAMYIGQRLNWYLNHGKSLRLDHLVVMYNAGGNVMDISGNDHYSGNFNKYVVRAGLVNADTTKLIRY